MFGERLFRNLKCPLLERYVQIITGMKTGTILNVTLLIDTLNGKLF